MDSVDPQNRLRVAEQLLTEHRLRVGPTAPFGSSFRDEAGIYPSYFGPGQSLVFLPLASIARAGVRAAGFPPRFHSKVTRFGVALLLLSLTLLTTYLLCAAIASQLGATEPVSHLIAFAAVFGSTLWQIVREGQEEGQLSILLLLGFYGFLRWKAEHRDHWLWISASAASAALLFRPTAVTVAGGLAALYGVNLTRVAGSPRQLRRYTQSYLVAAGVAAVVPLVLVGWYNWFKTGHPLRPGYPSLQHSFGSGNAWAGLVGPTVGLDRGAIWQNLWILPAAAVTIVRWRYLSGNVKVAVRLAALLFVAAVLLYCRWETWAGDHTFGARFQQHVIPLLAVALLTASTAVYIAEHRRARAAATPLLILLAALQIPSIAFVHNLEILQAEVSGRAARPGETNTAVDGGQLATRYRNVASKLKTGFPIQLDTVAPRAVSESLLLKSSRWDFWPWRLGEFISAQGVQVAKAVWGLTVLASAACWLAVLTLPRISPPPPEGAATP
jgi:hypothetical protein